MIQRHQVFAQLTSTLSRIYFDLERASGVAKDAGLDPTAIKQDTTPLNYWRNILEQAEHQRAVEDLLDVVDKEYPKEERLRAARAAYQDWVKVGRPGVFEKAGPGRSSEKPDWPMSVPSQYCRCFYQQITPTFALCAEIWIPCRDPRNDRSKRCNHTTDNHR